MTLAEGALVLAAALMAGVLAAAGVGAIMRRKGSPQQDLRPMLDAQAMRLDRVADVLGRQSREEGVLRDGLERTREALVELRARSEERRRSEEAGWDVVRRLESVLLGGAARGMAGENVLDEALSCLPPGMVERGFRVRGKEVEFALVLPDGRRLPVDSKWTALREAEALEEEEDPAARQVLTKRIEDEVSRRAREVNGYIDPVATTPFAVACVPDPAFAACRKAHGEAFAHGVVLAPYSTAMPLVLALYSLAARTGDAGDVQACLGELEALLGAMERTLENKVARAAATLHNATEEWRSYVGKARGALARGRGVEAPTDPRSLPRIVPPDDPALESREGLAAGG